MSSIKLTQGTLQVKTEQLVINDGAKMQYVMAYVGLIIALIYGITSLISFQKSDDPIMFYAGLIITIISASSLMLVLIRLLRRKVGGGNINFAKLIDFVQFRRNAFERLIVEIMLLTNSRRWISGRDEKSNTDQLLEILKTNQITVKVEPSTF